MHIPKTVLLICIKANYQMPHVPMTVYETRTYPDFYSAKNCLLRKIPP